MSQITWLFLVTLAPLLWSVCNHIDKIVLEKYFKGSVGAVIIIAALASALALPFLYVMEPAVLNVQMNGDFAIIAIAAVLDVVILWAYLNAVQGDDPSRAVAYYQLLPVMGIGTGWLFLGETISGSQMLAMVVILFGTSILSFEKIGGVRSFQWKTFGYMLLAVSSWAVELAIFKVAAIEENVWRSLFWKHVVLVVIGIVIFCCIPKYRKGFLEAMRENSAGVLALNVLNETLYMAGTISYGVAVMHAPVAMVLLTETFQSIFVFILAIFIAKFIPKFATESIAREHLARRGVAIAITAIGTYLLLVA